MKAVKTTPKATKTVHPYRIDGDGYPCSVKFKDVPKQGAIWGEVSGRALVLDLFNWREVLSEQQVKDSVTDDVRSLMEEAAKELQTPYVKGEFFNRRGVAIGVLECFAVLVAHALESKDARAYMEQHLSDIVQEYGEYEAKENAEARAKALDIHGIALTKGGPLNE